MAGRVKFLGELESELGTLMWAAEEHFGENAAGTYPTEVEMTLRFAWLTVRRAREAAEQPESAAVGV